MNENTTNIVPLGFVILSLDRLEELEYAESKAAIARRILTEDRLSSYDLIDTLRAVFNAYPVKPEKGSEE